MRILAIGAHADDIEVSVGGTIAHLRELNHEVQMLVHVIPCEDKNGNSCVEKKSQRLKYQKNAAKILDADVKILDLDPHTLQYNRKLVQGIDKAIRELKPNLIFTHWNGDSHQDHKAIASATFSAARRNDVSVLLYEQLTLGGITPFSFKNHVYVDISNVIETKIKSVRAYKFLSDGDIEAVYSLARFRGNQIGVKYAECFEVCKAIAHVDESGLVITGFND